jgi:hypothetical protein
MCLSAGKKPAAAARPASNMSTREIHSAMANPGAEAFFSSKLTMVSPYVAAPSIVHGMIAGD